MNRLILFFLMVGVSKIAHVQELPPTTTQQLEDASQPNEEAEDENYIHVLQHFKKNPINLNGPGIDELKELHFITDLHIQNLISYRKLAGPLLSLYEMQAIPGWNIQLIQKVRSYVTVSQPLLSRDEIVDQVRKGEHLFQLRISQVFQKGGLSGTNDYPGSPQNLYFRYRFTYRNILQFGFLGEKDAGEQFFKGAQKTGFDFYSFHIQVNGKGPLKRIVLGDFIVNMGQGLIHWQSMAFGKGAEVMNIKRQSPLIKTYSSAGEFNFHRGAGITIQKGRVQIAAFVSRRRLSANVESDTIYNKEYVTSILTSGYHRTPSELKGRNKLGQTTYGATISLQGYGYRVSMNVVNYSYSMPLLKRDEPYNLYAIKGRAWYNWSADFSYTWKNVHSFGELAFDKHLNRAFLTGLMISADPKLDLSIIYRSISPVYQALAGNAFTEGTSVSNESGIYAGLCFRPDLQWKMTAYIDLFRFPWLKYQVHAPSGGSEHMIQLNYFPQKQIDFYVRFRIKIKGELAGSDTSNIPYLVQKGTQNWRLHLGVGLGRALTFRTRVEILTTDNKMAGKGGGFLTYSEILFKPFNKSFGGSMRIQFTEANGYDLRIYAYEDDGTPGGSIISHWGKCFRYYLTFNHKLSKKFTYSCRWAHTLPIRTVYSPTNTTTLNVVGKLDLKMQLTLII